MTHSSQPGTTLTLQASISSPFNAVRYGAISVASNTVTVALAYHNTTSDDFNPSITVTSAGGSQAYIWLNWAYTDTPDAVNGVLPGQGVPNETGTEITLVKGSSTSTNFRFGDSSSLEVDPSAVGTSCPAGRTAVLAQEYFNSCRQVSHQACTHQLLLTATRRGGTHRSCGPLA